MGAGAAVRRGWAQEESLWVGRGCGCLKEIFDAGVGVEQGEELGEELGVVLTPDSGVFDTFC
jgi:hypothetical protein